MDRYRLRMVGALTALALLFWGSGGCSRASRNSMTLAGSTAFQPFAEKLAERYLSLHPDIRVNVQGGGSAVGIQSALSGTAQIGMADLVELPAEAKELQATVVARDGIALIVHPSNPVRNLSREQVKAVFSGNIANWKDVGGKDAPIRIISREDGSGTRRSFDTLILQGTGLVSNALYQNSNGTAREAVASDPNAIGYISMGLVDARVKALAFDGIVPSKEVVKRGAYPLARPVYFLTKAPLSERVQAFLDYVLLPESQAELEREGLIAAH